VPERVKAFARQESHAVPLRHGFYSIVPDWKEFVFIAKIITGK
jgi:hypothetical protein